MTKQMAGKAEYTEKERMAGKMKFSERKQGLVTCLLYTSDAADE